MILLAGLFTMAMIVAIYVAALPGNNGGDTTPSASTVTVTVDQDCYDDNVIEAHGLASEQGASAEDREALARAYCSVPTP